MLTHLIEWYGGSNPVLDCTRKLTGKVGGILIIVIAIIGVSFYIIDLLFKAIFKIIKGK